MSNGFVLQFYRHLNYSTSSAVVQNKFKVSFNKSYHRKAPKILLKWTVTRQGNRTEETSVCWILLLKIQFAIYIFENDVAILGLSLYLQYWEINKSNRKILDGFRLQFSTYTGRKNPAHSYFWRNPGNNLSYELLSTTRRFLRDILAHGSIMWRLGILSGYGCLILLYVQAHLRLYCVIIADDAVAAIDNDDVGDGDGVCDLWCFLFNDDEVHFVLLFNVMAWQQHKFACQHLDHTILSEQQCDQRNPVYFA
uniref:Uncharacterized protein n=1 Tax=Glossina pallidipes TaxID=7398 RepID=A0A1A9ZJZ4_GLOPL